MPVGSFEEFPQVCFFREWENHPRSDGGDTKRSLKPGAVELEDFFLVALNFRDRIVDSEILAILTTNDTRCLAAASLHPIIQRLQSPILNLIDCDADLGVEQNDVRTEPVEVRLNVDLPIRR